MFMVKSQIMQPNAFDITNDSPKFMGDPENVTFHKNESMEKTM